MLLPLLAVALLAALESGAEFRDGDRGGDPAPAWVEAAAVGIVTLDVALWYASLEFLFSTGAAQRIHGVVRRPLDRLAGAVMIAFGGPQNSPRGSLRLTSTFVDMPGRIVRTHSS
ncbi:MAG: hypothetical protein ACHQRJ_21250 [Alphaproteobacteria bacterium]